MQTVTGSDLKFDYKKIAGVNNLDDPAVKSSGEDKEIDRKRQAEHTQLHHSFCSTSIQTYWRADSSGDRSSYNPFVPCFACAFLKTLRFLKSHCRMKSILSFRWASKTITWKEIWKISKKSEQQKKKKELQCNDRTAQTWDKGTAWSSLKLQITRTKRTVGSNKTLWKSWL